jgi:hypothetical protein
MLGTFPELPVKVNVSGAAWAVVWKIHTARLKASKLRAIMGDSSS